MKKKLLPISVLCLLGLIATGCSGGGASSSVAPSSQPASSQPASSEPIVYSVAISNKEALQAEWYVVDGDRDISLTAAPGVVKTLIEEGKIAIESSDPTIISVSKAKLIPLKSGKATIKVTYGTASDSVELTVTGEEKPYTATDMETAVNAAIEGGTTPVGPYELVGVVTEVIGNNGYYISDIAKNVGCYIYKTIPSNVSNIKEIEIGSTVHYHGWIYSYNGLIETYFNSSDAKYAQTAWVVKDKGVVEVPVKNVENISDLGFNNVGTLVNINGLSLDGYTAPYSGKSRACSIAGDDGAIILLNYHVGEKEDVSVLNKISNKLDLLETGPYTFNLKGVVTSVSNNAFSFEVTDPTQLVINEIAAADIVKPASINLAAEGGAKDVAPSGTLQINPELIAQDETKRVNWRGIDWSVENDDEEETDPLATISSTGLVTAGEKAGAFTVTAKSQANKEVIGTLKLAVKAIDQEKTVINAASLLAYTDTTKTISYSNDEVTTKVNGDPLTYVQIGGYPQGTGEAAVCTLQTRLGSDSRYASKITTGRLKAPIQSIEVAFNTVKMGTYTQNDYLKVVFSVDENFAEETSEAYVISFDMKTPIYKFSPSDITKYQYVSFEHVATYGANYDYIQINYIGGAYKFPYATDGSAADQAFSIADARQFVFRNLENSTASADKFFVKGVVSAVELKETLYDLTIKDETGRSFAISGATLGQKVTAPLVGDEVVINGNLKRSGNAFTIENGSVASSAHLNYTVSVDTKSSDKVEITGLPTDPVANGSEFTFQVALKEQGYKVDTVTVNDVAVTAVEGVYTGKVLGKTLVKVTVVEDKKVTKQITMACSETLPMADSITLNNLTTANVGINDTNVSFYYNKNSASTDGVMFKDNGEFRLYGTKATHKGNIFGVKVGSSFDITTVTISFSSADYSQYAKVFAGPIAVDATTGEVTGTLVTAVEGVYTINASEFYIVCDQINNAGTKNGQVRFTQIVFTYTNETK